jgi:cellulose synthase/poly-beta-1,6-N-acetylglucosamine synthase-like glycosyltransferase
MAVLAPHSQAPRATPASLKRTDARFVWPTGELGRIGRRALVLAFLMPLFAIVTVKLFDISGDWLFAAYGVGVIGSTCLVMYLAFGTYVDPSEGPAPPDWSPKVTMLLAVHNEIDQIEDCIESIITSTYPNLEIIVIDDASTDGTAELLAKPNSMLLRLMLRRMVEDGKFQLIALKENVGKKAALVEGVRRSSGDILAFTDSDCRLDADALELCVRALGRNPEFGAVSGHARALNSEKNFLTRVQDVWYDGQFGVSKAAEATLGSVTCVSGPLAVFRREAIENYFPAWANDTFAGREFRFATDRQLTGYVLGQVWLGAELKAKYATDPLVTTVDHPPRLWRIGYVRAAKVWTNVPETVKGFMKQQIRWKKSFTRNLFFTGTFIWRRGIRIAVIYYLHVIFVLVAPLMATRHLIVMPLLGMWWLVVLYFAGIFLKGAIWGMAFRAQNPGSDRWVYRPLMSVVSAMCLSWLLFYSVATLRKGTWSRTL